MIGLKKQTNIVQLCKQEAVTADDDKNEYLRTELQSSGAFSEAFSQQELVSAVPASLFKGNRTLNFSVSVLCQARISCSTLSCKAAVLVSKDIWRETCKLGLLTGVGPAPSCYV